MAQQMLSQLRDLLDRLQTGQMQKKDGERGQMMMKKLDELGNIIGQQQRLMDETYSEHRKQAQRQLGGTNDGGREQQSNGRASRSERRRRRRAAGPTGKGSAASRASSSRARGSASSSGRCASSWRS